MLQNLNTAVMATDVEGFHRNVEGESTSSDQQASRTSAIDQTIPLSTVLKNSNKSELSNATGDFHTSNEGEPTSQVEQIDMSPKMSKNLITFEEVPTIEDLHEENAKESTSSHQEVGATLQNPNISDMATDMTGGFHRTIENKSTQNDQTTYPVYQSTFPSMMLQTLKTIELGPAIASANASRTSAKSRNSNTLDIVMGTDTEVFHTNNETGSPSSEQRTSRTPSIDETAFPSSLQNLNIIKVNFDTEDFRESKEVESTPNDQQVNQTQVDQADMHFIMSKNLITFEDDLIKEGFHEISEGQSTLYDQQESTAFSADQIPLPSVIPQKLITFERNPCTVVVCKDIETESPPNDEPVSTTSTKQKTSPSISWDMESFDGFHDNDVGKLTPIVQTTFPLIIPKNLNMFEMDRITGVFHESNKEESTSFDQQANRTSTKKITFNSAIPQDLNTYEKKTATESLHASYEGESTPSNQRVGQSQVDQNNKRLIISKILIKFEGDIPTERFQEECEGEATFSDEKAKETFPISQITYHALSQNLNTFDMSTDSKVFNENIETESAPSEQPASTTFPFVDIAFPSIISQNLHTPEINRATGGFQQSKEGESKSSDQRGTKTPTDQITFNSISQNRNIFKPDPTTERSHKITGRESIPNDRQESGTSINQITFHSKLQDRKTFDGFHGNNVGKSTPNDQQPSKTSTIDKIAFSSIISQNLNTPEVKLANGGFHECKVLVAEKSTPSDQRLSTTPFPLKISDKDLATERFQESKEEESTTSDPRVREIPTDKITFHSISQDLNTVERDPATHMFHDDIGRQLSSNNQQESRSSINQMTCHSISREVERDMFHNDIERKSSYNNQQKSRSSINQMTCHSISREVETFDGSPKINDGKSTSNLKQTNKATLFERTTFPSISRNLSPIEENPPTGGFRDFKAVESTFCNQRITKTPFHSISNNMDPVARGIHRNVKTESTSNGQQASRPSSITFSSAESQTDITMDALSAYVNKFKQQKLRLEFQCSEEAEFGTDLGIKSKPQSTNAGKPETSKSITKKSNHKKTKRKAVKGLQMPPLGNFVFGIIDHSNAYGRINEEHHTMLEEAFNGSLANLMLECPDDCPDIQINKSEFIEGIFVISVASKDCAEELRELVEQIPPLWPGAKLRFVRDIVLPLLTKAAFCVRCCGAQLSTEEILRILRRQNSGLAFDLWQIYRRVEIEDGAVFVVGLDPSSVKCLRKSKELMYFLTSEIEVKMDSKLLCEYSLRELKRNRVLAMNVLGAPRPTSRQFDRVVKEMIDEGQASTQRESAV